MSKRRVIIDPDGKELNPEEDIRDYIETEPLPIDEAIEQIVEEKVEEK